MKVAVIGGAGGIGQALAMLLKNRLPDGSKLSLYDIAPVTPGVAADLAHIPTPVTVVGHAGDDMSLALEGADIVLVSAGVARKPGMSRADLFNVNAGIIKSVAEHVAATCPKALFGVITNPVNTLVPIAAKVLEKAGVYDKRRLFGITTLDVIRSETFVSDLKEEHPADMHIPVIGGHSATTILPLLSQARGVELSEIEVEALTHRIQNAGTEVVEAKAGGGSATLSMAQAACRFGMALVDALNGKEGIVECAYVEGDGKYTRFFAQPVILGKEGIEGMFDYGELSAFEQETLDGLIETLQEDITKGEEFEV